MQSSIKKTKDAKHYCFLVHKTLLFLYIFFFFWLRSTWAELMIHDFGGGPKLESKGAQV